MTAVTSCNKTNNVSTSNETNNVFSKEIDEDGGTVGQNGGLSVYIPGGAVGEKLLVTIREAEAGEYPTPPASLASPVYVIEPLGLELAAKATVHLPFPEGWGAQGTGYQGLAPVRPNAGGSWQQIPGGLDPDASTATFDSFTFSFFALDAVGIGPGAGGGPAGSAGGAAVPASGGTSGLGGSTGVGATAGTGPGPGEEFCMPDLTAPEGTSNVAGELQSAPFQARDGFAAIMEEGDQKILLLTLTEHITACGSALAAGIAVSPKPVRGAQPGLSLGFSAHLHFPSTDIEPDVYPRQSEPDMIEMMTYELGSMCDEKPMSAPSTVSLTIDAIDADHVAGSVEVVEYPGGPVIANGTFDVPICPLPDAPSGPPCCVMP